MYESIDGLLDGWQAVYTDKKLIAGWMYRLIS